MQPISYLVRYMAPVNRRRFIEHALWGVAYSKRVNFSGLLAKRKNDTDVKAGSLDVFSSLRTACDGTLAGWHACRLLVEYHALFLQSCNAATIYWAIANARNTSDVCIIVGDVGVGAVSMWVMSPTRFV